MGLLNKLKDSNLGLKGATPDLRIGALPTSELHAQGTPAELKSDHSIHDLDGRTPEKYLDNKPE